MEIICGVYQIKNIINNKIYIGSSVNVNKRWENHKRLLTKNTHHNTYLQRSFNKHGDSSFDFTILEVVDNEDLLLEREQYYIDSLDSCNKKIGYNISLVAGSPMKGLTHSEETKKKISELQKGRKHSYSTILKMRLSNKSRTLNMSGSNNPFYGKSHSEYTKEKLRKIRINFYSGENHPLYGTKLSDDTKEKIGKANKGKLSGEKNHASKLTEEKVKIIKSKILDGERIDDIANEFQVSNVVINNIKLGRNWNHVEPIFEVNTNKRKRLTEQDVIEIKKLLLAGNDVASIALMFGVTKSAIWDIRRGRKWPHVSIS